MNDYERLQDALLDIRNSAHTASRLTTRILDHDDTCSVEEIEAAANDLLAKLRRKAREQSLAGVDKATPDVG